MSGPVPGLILHPSIGSSSSRAGAALRSPVLCQEHLLPSCSRTGALLVLLGPGESEGTWQGTMAWGCPGAVPSQDHSAGEEGEEQGQCLCPGRAGSQACAPCEPRGSVTLILALSASPLAGLPLPLSEIPHCLCQILTGREVRAASAGLGSAGCSWSPCLGADYSPSSLRPQTGLCAPPLRPVNISLSAVGCCSLDDHRDAAEWLQSQAGSQEPTGAACCLSPPSPKAFPGRLRAERGCVPAGPGREGPALFAGIQPVPKPG